VFTDEELREIHLLEEGEQMTKGEEYFDLTYPEGKPFVNQAEGATVPADSLYVIHSHTPEDLWCRLITHHAAATKIGGLGILPEDQQATSEGT
jgi:hypothetical protein